MTGAEFGVGVLVLVYIFGWAMSFLINGEERSLRAYFGNDIRKPGERGITAVVKLSARASVWPAELVYRVALKVPPYFSGMYDWWFKPR